MKMKSVMKHQFSNIPAVNIPRSTFDRTHCYKTTFDAGYLIPFYVDEALPGDTFNFKATLFARMNTLITPFMDNLFMDTFYFAVPMRLVWSNTQKFFGEKDDPDDTTQYYVPQIVAPATTGWAIGSLSDYFGLPVGVPGISVSALWHRAYNLIWNEWFRDQNLQEAVDVNKDAAGPDSNSDYVLLKRGKRHDYFTSCLPWPQKGEGVALPLGEYAPVEGIGKANQVYGATNDQAYETDGTGLVTYAKSAEINPITNFTYRVEEDPDNAGFPNIKANLSTATAATVNELRLAFQAQKFLEKCARGGTRYTEMIRSHFGVVSPDARLQRPEFLGGNSTPVYVHTVAQTHASPGENATWTTPQGNLAAFGTITSNKEGFTKSFTEHCLIMGIVSIRADLTYQQGIPRMFGRRIALEYYWPSLAHLGEQGVYNAEIYAQDDANVNPVTGLKYNEEIFGYQERWAEYRYYPSKITGKLRSYDDAYGIADWGSLDVWHLSQVFESLPTLSPEFIAENPPVDRVIAVTSEPQFLFDSFIQCKTVRPMPVYSVPGLIDHF